MSIRRVVPNITTDKVDDTVAFFVDLLGFEVAMDSHDVVTVVSPDNATAQVNILRGGGEAAGGGGNPALVEPHLSVEVADVDAVHEAARQRGLEITYPLTDESWGVRRFFVTEPNGLVLNVMMHTE